MWTLLLPLVLAAPPQDSASEPIVVREVLAVERLGERSRSAVYTDALEARLARGTWSYPAEGDTIRSATGDERTWSRVEAAEDGWFRGPAFRGGWAVARVDVPEAGAWRLDLRGANAVYVDGAPHAGDIYSLGLTRIPLPLAEGTHELLFRGGRGSLRAILEPAPAPLYLEERDRTLPDALRDQPGEVLIGQIVANASVYPARGLAVVARVGETSTRTELPILGPASFRKCAVRVGLPVGLAYDSVSVTLDLVGADDAVLHESELTLAVRSESEKHARTFVSEIDGSVQYFAVTPPSVSTEDVRPGLLLTLHGAGVEARGQASSYAPKPDLVVVAPTNRRPFGFDWEDWGRLDALEVLDLASARFDTDPRRTWLSGHSMGGHGTWQVGAHFPDRFAAIAPSAGWRDFWSYAGGATFTEGDAIGAYFARSVNTSRTALLDRNYLNGGVYVLHGDADDNVPVSEARAMRARLAEFHPNFAYYERPGAGHWWGNACVDWPPLFEFLGGNVLPEPGTQLAVEFVTVNPAVSNRCAWVSVEGQPRWLEPSRVLARLEAGARRVDLELENVSRLALDLSAFARPRGAQEPLLAAGAPLTVRVGEDEFETPFDDAEDELYLEYRVDRWVRRQRPGPWYKAPHRAGPFKEAFRNRMVFVYGTHGTPEENAWSYAKARYDHETWRYRGNGAVDVVPDVEFEALAYAGRNVVLYGHRELNSAWSQVLGAGAFGVGRGALYVGGHRVEGDDLALLAVYPRDGDAAASVAVVAGTGMAGMRTTDHLPYFVSGVGYPDWTVFDASFLERGLEGVRGAGFFRDDWSPEEGAEEAWRE